MSRLDDSIFDDDPVGPTHEGAYDSHRGETYSSYDERDYSSYADDAYSSSRDESYTSYGDDLGTPSSSYGDDLGTPSSSYGDDLYSSPSEDTYATQEHEPYTYEEELDAPTGEQERVLPAHPLEEREPHRRLTRAETRRAEREGRRGRGRDQDRGHEREHDQEHDDGLHRADDRGRGRGSRRGCGSCLAMFLAGALVVAAIWFAAGSLGSLIPGFGGPKDYPGPGHGSVEVVVDNGASGAQIGEALVTAGVVKSTSSFTEVAMAQPERAAKIQPGTYSMLKEMKAADAFEMLLDPQSKAANGLTIPEGLWRSEIYTRLSEGTGVPLSDYQAAETSPALELPEEAGGSLEGWLFPSTYEFGDDATAVDQLNKMIALTVKELEKAEVPQDEWERTLIIASIVEGESGAADRAKVARVIENRLEDVTGPTVGMLQMDSTIHYMLQKRGTVTTSDKERNTDSPYNTYKNKGLPPGPINNPGAAAIDAASHPADGDWLFFVTVDPESGETKFTADPEEHQENVQEFCRNTGSCE